MKPVTNFRGRWKTGKQSYMNRLIIITGMVVAVCVYLLIILPWLRERERGQKAEIYSLQCVKTATHRHLISGGSLPSDWQTVFKVLGENYGLSADGSNGVAKILRSNYEIVSNHVTVLGPHGSSELFVMRREPAREPARGLGRWVITVSGTNVVQRWLPESELQTYLQSDK